MTIPYAEIGITTTQLNRVCRAVLGHPALAVRQGVGRHADDDGVVPGQDDVHPDDLEQGRPQQGVVDRHESARVKRG